MEKIYKRTRVESIDGNNTTWNCNHFSKANEYLRTNNMEEIKWL